MSRFPRQADLVARALGVLPDVEQARVDRALEGDPRLRQRFEEIAGHLLQYENLPAAPPAPPFARIEAAMDADVTPDLRILRLGGARRGGRPWAVGAAAAAVLVAALLVWRPWAPAPGGADVRLVPGPGLVVLRGADALPAPARAVRPLEIGDRLVCGQPAEASLDGRTRVVLDGGSSLRLEGRDVWRLEDGRAWFEVGAGSPFEVRTAYGQVRVLGTAFEVDVREGRLDVAVAEGRVRAGPVEVAAGERLAAGRVESNPFPPGAWFREPQLHLELAEPAPPAREPLELRLVFSNPGNVPLRLEGPLAARTPLWIRFETLEGRTRGELPVLAANVTAGLELLRPGGVVDLPAGGRSVLTVRILPPSGSPGAYRCRALYRPEDRPAVLSSPLEIEVR